MPVRAPAQQIKDVARAILGGMQIFFQCPVELVINILGVSFRRRTFDRIGRDA